MKRASVVSLVLLVIACIVGVIILIDNLLGSRHKEEAIRHAQAESIKVLSEAETPEQLEAAVEPLGILLKLQDGEWVAIRYKDSHAHPIWSSAVVRDSGGEWFRSEEHFCGKFQSHRLDRDTQGSIDQQLRLIESAAGLPQARAILREMGFEPMPAIH